MAPRPGPSLLALAITLGCIPSPSDDPPTSDPAPTTATTEVGTTTTMAADTTAATALDTTHGQLTEFDPTGDDCERFEFTEVDGCPAPVGESFCSEGSAHHPIDTELTWEANPPHSGPHWPMWSTWGEHPSTLAREMWVHNLEHGGIVLSYRCPGGCEPQLEILRTVMEMRPDLRILITPDPELPADGFAAISWTWVYGFDSPDLDTLLCFVDQHENHAPEDVP
ncbi:MAG: DUF3105 domain-containing protein [Myxococcota bacterium]